MSDRGTCWSLTINNPTKSDDEWIAQAQQKKGWKLYGQREKGAEGTEHYQLMLTTPQVRFSAIKKAFPRAHIELARDRRALEKYVQKEDTRIGDVPISDKYPAMSKVMAWYGEYYDQVVSLHGDNKVPLLDIFDTMIKQKIMEGYYVESFGVNPQVRAQIKQYGKAIAFRERLSRRQPDRQTTENLVPDIDITNADIQVDGQERDEESSGETLSCASSCSTFTSST